MAAVPVPDIAGFIIGSDALTAPCKLCQQFFCRMDKIPGVSLPQREGQLGGRDLIIERARKTDLIQSPQKTIPVHSTQERRLV